MIDDTSNFSSSLDRNVRQTIRRKTDYQVSLVTAHVSKLQRQLNLKFYDPRFLTVEYLPIFLLRFCVWQQGFDINRFFVIVTVVCNGSLHVIFRICAIKKAN